MANAQSFQLEIDGVPTEFDGIYDEAQFRAVGGIFGANETTGPTDSVRNFRPTKAVYCLGVWGRKPDGGIWGIQGLYARGEWSTAPDGSPLYRVWDRIV
jgi:hypothetical protein